MITCKRATELISKSMEQRLSIKEKIFLRMHLSICSFCQYFKEQAQLIRTAFLGQEFSSIESEIEKPPAVDKAQKRLKEQLGLSD